MLAAPLMLSTAPKLQAAVVGSVGTCVDLEPMAMAEEVILTAIPRVNGDHIEVDIISHPASTTRVWSANHLLRGKLYPLMDGSSLRKCVPGLSEDSQSAVCCAGDRRRSPVAHGAVAC